MNRGRGRARGNWHSTGHFAPFRNDHPFDNNRNRHGNLGDGFINIGRAGYCGNANRGLVRPGMRGPHGAVDMRPDIPAQVRGSDYPTVYNQGDDRFRASRYRDRYGRGTSSFNPCYLEGRHHMVAQIDAEIHRLDSAFAQYQQRQNERGNATGRLEQRVFVNRVTRAERYFRNRDRKRECAPNLRSTSPVRPQPVAKKAKTPPLVDDDYVEITLESKEDVVGAVNEVEIVSGHGDVTLAEDVPHAEEKTDHVHDGDLQSNNAVNDAAPLSTSSPKQPKLDAKTMISIARANLEKKQNDEEVPRVRSAHVMKINLKSGEVEEKEIKPVDNSAADELSTLDDTFRRMQMEALGHEMEYLTSDVISSLEQRMSQISTTSGPSEIESLSRTEFELLELSLSELLCENERQPTSVATSLTNDRPSVPTTQLSERSREPKTMTPQSITQSDRVTQNGPTAMSNDQISVLNDPSLPSCQIPKPINQPSISGESFPELAIPFQRTSTPSGQMSMAISQSTEGCQFTMFGDLLRKPSDQITVTNNQTTRTCLQFTDQCVKSTESSLQKIKDAYCDTFSENDQDPESVENDVCPIAVVDSKCVFPVKKLAERGRDLRNIVKIKEDAVTNTQAQLSVDDLFGCPFFAAQHSNAYEEIRKRVFLEHPLTGMNVVQAESIAHLTDVLNEGLALEFGVLASEWRLDMPKCEGRESPCAFLPNDDNRVRILRSLTRHDTISPVLDSVMSVEDMEVCSDDNTDVEDEGTNDYIDIQGRHSRARVLLSIPLIASTMEASHATQTIAEESSAVQSISHDLDEYINTIIEDRQSVNSLARTAVVTAPDRCVTPTLHVAPSTANSNSHFNARNLVSILNHTALYNADNNDQKVVESEDQEISNTLPKVLHTSEQTGPRNMLRKSFKITNVGVNSLQSRSLKTTSLLSSLTEDSITATHALCNTLVPDFPPDVSQHLALCTPQQQTITTDKFDCDAKDAKFTEEKPKENENVGSIETKCIPLPKEPPPPARPEKPVGLPQKNLDTQISSFADLNPAAIIAVTLDDNLLNDQPTIKPCSEAIDMDIDDDDIGNSPIEIFQSKSSAAASQITSLMDTELVDAITAPSVLRHVEPDMSRTNQKEPEMPRTNQTEPEMFRTNQTEPEMFRTNQVEPEMSWTNHVEPEMTWTNHVEPEMTWTNQVISMSSHSPSSAGRYPVHLSARASPSIAPPNTTPPAYTCYTRPPMTGSLSDITAALPHQPSYICANDSDDRGSRSQLEDEIIQSSLSHGPDPILGNRRESSNHTRTQSLTMSSAVPRNLVVTIRNSANEDTAHAPSRCQSSESDESLIKELAENATWWEPRHEATESVVEKNALVENSPTTSDYEYTMDIDERTPFRQFAIESITDPECSSSYASPLFPVSSPEENEAELRAKAIRSLMKNLVNIDVDTDSAHLAKLQVITENPAEEFEPAVRETNNTDINCGTVTSSHEINVVPIPQTYPEVANTNSEVVQTCPEVAQTCPEVAQTYQDVAQTYTEVAQTCPVVAQTYPEVVHTYPEVAQTYPEVANTNSEVVQTYLEVAQTYPEVAQTYSEVTQTYPEVAQTNSEVAQTNSEVSQTYPEVANTNSEVAQTYTEVAQMYPEVNDGHECLLTEPEKVDLTPDCQSCDEITCSRLIQSDTSLEEIDSVRNSIEQVNDDVAQAFDSELMKGGTASPPIEFGSKEISDGSAAGTISGVKVDSIESFEPDSKRDDVAQSNEMTYEKIDAEIPEPPLVVTSPNEVNSDGAKSETDDSALDATGDVVACRSPTFVIESNNSGGVSATDITRDSVSSSINNSSPVATGDGIVAASLDQAPIGDEPRPAGVEASPVQPDSVVEADTDTFRTEVDQDKSVRESFVVEFVSSGDTVPTAEDGVEPMECTSEFTPDIAEPETVYDCAAKSPKSDQDNSTEKTDDLTIADDVEKMESQTDAVSQPDMTSHASNVVEDCAMDVVAINDDSITMSNTATETVTKVLDKCDIRDPLKTGMNRSMSDTPPSKADTKDSSLGWPVFNPSGYTIPKKNRITKGGSQLFQRSSSDGATSRASASALAAPPLHSQTLSTEGVSAQSSHQSPPRAPPARRASADSAGDTAPNRGTTTRTARPRVEFDTPANVSASDDGFMAVDEDEDDDDDDDDDELPACLNTSTVQNTKNGDYNGARLTSCRTPGANLNQVGDHSTVDSLRVNKPSAPRLPVTSTEVFSLEALHAEKREQLSDAGVTYSMKEKQNKEKILKGGFRRVMQDCEEVQEMELSDELKDRLSKMKSDDVTILQCAPGDVRFRAELCGRYFTSTSLTLSMCGFRCGTSRVDYHLANADHDQLTSLIRGDILCIGFPKITCKEAFLLWLFNLMSICADEYCIRDAHRLLYHIITDCRMKWAPSIIDVTRVFLNYGAEMSALYPADCHVTITEADVRLPPDGSQVNQPASGVKQPAQAEFRLLNLQCTVQTISVCVQKCWQLYSKSDLKLLVVLLCSVGLDTRITKGAVRYDMEVCLQAILDKFAEGDWPEVMFDLCLNLTHVTSHHHNRLQMARLMPPTSRGLQLQRRLAYTLLLDTLPESQMSSAVLDTSRTDNVKAVTETAPTNGKVPNKEDILDFKLSCLTDVVSRLSSQPVRRDVYYLLSSIIQLIDLAVGNETLHKTERSSLLSLDHSLELMTSSVRDSCRNLDTSTIKDLIQRTLSKWTFLLRDMGKTQRTLFAHYKTPETQETASSGDDTAVSDTEQSLVGDVSESEPRPDSVLGEGLEEGLGLEKMIDDEPASTSMTTSIEEVVAIENCSQSPTNTR